MRCRGPTPDPSPDPSPSPSPDPNLREEEELLVKAEPAGGRDEGGLERVRLELRRDVPRHGHDVRLRSEQHEGELEPHLAREMWGDVGRCGEIRGDMGRYGEIRGDVGRYGEMFRF